MKKPHVLLFSDNPFSHSGIAAMGRHICFQLLKQGFDVSVLAVMQAIPPGLAQNTIHKTEYGNVKVKITKSFADIPVLFAYMQEVKPDVLVLSQDPHFYYQLFQHTPVIRKDIPIVFLHIWDTNLVPQLEGTAHFNLPMYESVDAIGAVSHQTHTFVNNVLTKQQYGKKPLVKYIGLGRDPEVFKPLPEAEYAEIKKDLVGEKAYDFIALLANRNQHRKHIPDTVEAWRLFNESLPADQATKTCLVLHTQPVPPGNSGPVGTDLNAVCTALAPKQNIVLSCQPLPEPQLNLLYNVADLCINCSSSEGFGLTTNEAALAGRPLLVNNTGGLKDQARPEFAYITKNHRTIIGSPLTPYLYDELAEIDDIANGFKYWHNVPRAERQRRGLLARNWALTQGLNSEAFSLKTVELIKETINTFTKQPLFAIYE